ncbi:hypothetical protein GN956_G13898 [Arapaima gigas]
MNTTPGSCFIKRTPSEEPGPGGAFPEFSALSGKSGRRYVGSRWNRLLLVSVPEDNIQQKSHDSIPVTLVCFTGSQDDCPFVKQKCYR